MRIIPLLALVCGFLLFAISGECIEDNPQAGLLAVGAKSENSAFTQALRGAGYSVTLLNYDDLCASVRLKRLKLLVLPDSSSLPIGSVKPITDYINTGGRIMALRTPMWRTFLVKSDGRWISQEDFRERACKDPRTDNRIVDWSASDVLSKWKRSTDNPAVKSSSVVVSDSRIDGSAIKVSIDHLTGWDIFASPDMKSVFPQEHTMTVFSAKASRNTDKLSIEWMESNGLRWIAVVQLSTRWQRYALAPEDFKRWYDGIYTAPVNRPFAPENAMRLSIGLAFSHTGRTAGPHEYSISAIETASLDPLYMANLVRPVVPLLDTLSPEFKFFDMTGVSKLSARTDQKIVDQASISVPKSMLSPFSRAKGAGLDKGRDWRWIPIIDGKNAKDEMRGTPITLMLHLNGERKGGMWASFGIQDRTWYQTSAGLGIIRQVASKMHDGLFIIEGGTDKYTYFEDQPVVLGAKVANFGDTVRNLKVRGSLVDSSLRKAMSKEWMLTLKPGEVRIVSDNWKTGNSISGGCKAVVELIDGKTVVDRVVHETAVWHPAKAKDWVTVKDGKFMRGGKRWRVHGVNYWPISSMASENPTIEARLFSKIAYDPKVIERDLRNIRGMGLNAVATALMMDELDSQNVTDFLRRCRNNDIKVFLHLGMYLTPMDDDWPKVMDIISKCRLADNDAVFAYDLCWELGFGVYDQRKRWDRDWEAWVIERYNSIDNAQQDWGIPIPRDDKGQVTSPRDVDISQNGSERRMVAAYRRFLNTLTYRQYSKARELMREVDPNHLVSFRMTESGNPTWRADGMCYDFPYFPGGVDFLGPEGWGRIGDWDFVKHAMFGKPYAKWAAPSLPLVWTEVGVSELMGTGDTKTTQALIDAQAQYHSDWYRVLNVGGGDGIFWWWYPGGYRFGEGTDYGIINPDGSDRPVSKVIRQNARKFIDGPDMKQPDHWIEFDTTETAGFPANMYDRIKGEFWKAIDDGQTPGLRTKGTGTTSADCPLTAVGGNPCDGNNPPEYMDGAFDNVEVMDSSGNWVPVTRNGTVRVTAGRKVVARVTVTNLGEARWLPGNGAGAVRVIAFGADGFSGELPVSTPRHSSVKGIDVILSKDGFSMPTETTLTFEAIGRIRFGEKFKMQIVLE
ncbi:MAG: beta-galactosidase [Armatimonadota bacterium]